MNTLFNNKLRGETSPYLLQHADNPVNWYPWGEEAFQIAAAEDKPVFLSVGYSACHWCHVMAKESFEDAAVAKLLNHAFVPVKVDREERPDVDTVYMEACRIMTGGGGWPLTVFLTPDKKPFYAGTYFPKRTSYGRPGLIELLEVVEREWRTNRKAILSNADIIVGELNKSEERLGTPSQKSIVESQYAYLKQVFDPLFGGFGQAPKFPMPSNLLFLAEYGGEDALSMLYTTLDAMYKGGIYDHIGGGFARYSTDRQWLVPHFEKMLYDNAQLIKAYALAYKLSGKELYKDIAMGIAGYIALELSGSEGGLYSAQDADSEGGEGLFYLLSPKEVQEVLGKEDADRFCLQYDITAKGNFEGKSIPNLISKDTECEISDMFATSKEKLYIYRKERMSLATDDKYLAFWNSLAAEALASAYKSIGDRRLLAHAKQTLAFVKDTLCEGKKVYTSYRDGRLGKGGVLDDIAGFIYACIGLYTATLDEGYLADAYYFCEGAVQEFFDDINGGFYLTANSGERMISRPKEVYDGVTPSGNSLMYYNFVYLSQLQEAGAGKLPNGVMDRQRDYLERAAAAAAQGFYAYAKIKEDTFSRLICVLPDGTDKQSFLADHKEALFAYDAVCFAKPSETYKLIGELATFYACTGGTCKPPNNVLPAKG